MNTHLCFDLKTFGQDRECFDKQITEGAVSGHDILDIAFKQVIDGISDNAVAKIVEGAFVFFEIIGEDSCVDLDKKCALRTIKTEQKVSKSDFVLAD